MSKGDMGTIRVVLLQNSKEKGKKKNGRLKFAQMGNLAGRPVGQHCFQ